MDVPISTRAQSHLNEGLQLKAKDNFEGALAQFRRAVLLDPTLFQAHYEIGLICKARAPREPFLQRHAFEAFRHAARLNLQHQPAHDEYILAGQKTKQLDELLTEYDNWLKHYPDNELLQRCKKNLITITMALIPDQVHVADASASKLLKTVVLYASLAMMLGGLMLAIGAPLFKKDASKEVMRGYFKIGSLVAATGIGCLILRSRLK